MPRPRSQLDFIYRFLFAKGESLEFRLTLDYQDLSLLLPPRQSFPDWTRLDYCRCANCPLQEAAHPRCPIAANLVDVVEAFRDRISFEEVTVEVEVQQRCYHKRASLQEGLSSMIGIVMVSSGCPVLDKLRPMVATHLPFMSSEESTYRVVSMYLLGQYFIARDGGQPDWPLDGLLAFLGDARIANNGVCERLRSLGLRDASLNALSILNAQGEITSIVILEDDLARWGRVFREHFGTSRRA